MKKIILVVISCVFVVVLTGRYSFAQMDSGMKMDDEMMKHMMEKCQPMMKQMMDDGMMKMGMMDMMMDMMNMQEKMMMGPDAAEKKLMMKDMAQMKEKMQMMMSIHMDMKGIDDSQSKLACAKQWLKEAIDLHEVHLKDPKTATEASQMEMMDQMKKAYDCITGTTPEISGTEVEPSKTDTHKH